MKDYTNSPLRCPKCSSPMHERVNRVGETFLGCKKFPACDGCRDADGYHYNAYDNGSAFGASFERYRSQVEILSGPTKGKGWTWGASGIPISEPLCRKLDVLRARLHETFGGGSRARIIASMFRVANGKDEPVPIPLPPDQKINAAMSLSRLMRQGTLAGVDFNDRLARFQDAVGIGRRQYDEITRAELARVLSVDLDTLPVAHVAGPRIEPIPGQPGVFRTADGQVIDIDFAQARATFVVGMRVMHKGDGRKGVVDSHPAPGWAKVRRDNGQMMEVPETDLTNVNVPPGPPDPPGVLRDASGKLIDIRDIRNLQERQMRGSTLSELELQTLARLYREVGATTVPAVNNQAAPAVPEKEEKTMKIEEQKTTMGKLKDQGSMFAGAVADGLADAAVEEAGDVLLDTAKDLFDDEALLAVLLASPDGRELLKCVTGFVLESVAVHGGIPKADVVSNVVQRQYRSSARRIGGPRIKKIMLRMTKLVEIGERLPQLRESNKTLTEELVETPAEPVAR